MDSIVKRFYIIIPTPMSEIISSLHSFVIKDAVNTARTFTKKYFLTLLGLVIISSVIPSFVEWMFDYIVQQIPGATQTVIDPLTNVPTNEPVGIWAIISSIVYIVIGIVWAWLGLWVIQWYFQILEDKKPRLNVLTSAPWMRVARLIGGGILVGLAVILWLIALILPGIWIAIRLSLFQYYIAEGYGATDAIKASWAATKDNFWQLFKMGFVYIGIFLLWVLALGIGLLWALPTIALAQAYVYKKLKANTPSDIKPIKEAVIA